MNFATVFDGLVPASLNPGVDFGAPVVVWTPTQSGIYALMISAPDAEGAPFMYADNIIVDMNAVVPGIQVNPAFVGNIGDQFQQGTPNPGPSVDLQTILGAPVRAVVKAALLASSEAGTGGDTLVVPLDELKRGLGIAIDDTTEDENLAQLEEQAVAWAEERLERRFRVPAERVDYIAGTGTRTLFLWGNVEDEVVTVAERTLGTKAWADLEEPDDVFELRPSARAQKLERVDGSAWARGVEYRVTWNDGFTRAPADIRALIIDAVNQARNALIAINDEGVVKSESIGDYSYTLDLSVSAGALAAGFSKPSTDTINRWRRVRA